MIVKNDYNLVQLQAKVQSQLSQYRFQHCLRTADKAVELAELNQGDVLKARVAGLVHDYAKERSDAEFISVIKQEHFDPDLLNYGNAIWHGVIGAYFIKHELGIYDEEILNAVRNHTTAAPQMTLLDKIVFMADYIEDGRDFMNVDEARQVTLADLDDGVRYQLTHTLELLLNKKTKIYPKTITSYNAWVAGH
ncbi:bis(5'-nucleosyl)-tetraphosphatase (symmetrical) YqeK [Bombilactobacillus thymidiniphilus]|uniref:bis(5'-nucleosyl)-tetraphosphatase (symmetrical) n=1 Tax=Bombilactobacillus thymidiniphilus TaxID=2923363 RepID=A0ABY4PC77_9LACO|nr:bis(5'-nucleosyl)-tetraphosphatase (symmetrical) YqeK [Bombilactobacillus thymidiniphilus]UQS83368.1 bis(5'-nucleosyl)-tetraphosphatase (symmetrical) YqeK [Bombilactobacillus thymidiniphilus]